jgi:hypothetical protein
MISGDEYKLWSSSLCNSIFLLLHPSLVQIFFSESCSQTPLVYALPLIWETKFHTHTKQLSELWFFIFNLYILMQQAGRQKTEPNGSKHSQNLISPFIQFWSVNVVPKHTTFAIFSKDHPYVMDSSILHCVTRIKVMARVLSTAQGVCAVCLLNQYSCGDPASMGYKICPSLALLILFNNSNLYHRLWYECLMSEYNEAVHIVMWTLWLKNTIYLYVTVYYQWQLSPSCSRLDTASRRNSRAVTISPNRRSCSVRLCGPDSWSGGYASDADWFLGFQNVLFR